LESTAVCVPHLGDFDAVQVIEVSVKAGDRVRTGDTLIILESEKATMEVPSPSPGVVTAISIQVGDKVSEGMTILTLLSEDADAAAPPVEAVPIEAGPPAEEADAAPAAPAAPPPSPAPAPPPEHAPSCATHASPAVRRVARDLGVDLQRVCGTGPLGRILQEDVLAYVRSSLAGRQVPGPAPTESPETPLRVAAWPAVDFGRFGPTETRPLSRIRKIAGANLHRNWVMIPHVTSHDEADITGLEAYRTRINEERGAGEPKVTLLSFLIEAAVASLKAFPEFNASLDGEALVLKRYYHIGFAVDTAEGLVVPVIRDADTKDVRAIARELAELSTRAREGTLAPADLQGGCFTISSLGGIGGTSFSPIIRAPEVAILGVCRAAIRPVWDGSRFIPRRILPLSLSWDHRVLDGAAATRFCAFFAQRLSAAAPHPPSPERAAIDA